IVKYTIMVFNPLHSLLEKNHEVLKAYVDTLEEELGDGSRIVGMIEIGSYAKGEAIPNSDIDTRIYVTNPDCYIWQAVISRFDESQKGALEKRFLEFEHEWGRLPRKEYDWWAFNNPLAGKISKALGVNVEFGLVDYRYANFELRHLNSFITPEHAIL